MESDIRADLLVGSDPYEKKCSPIGDNQSELPARSQFNVEAAIPKERSEPAATHLLIVDLTSCLPRRAAAILIRYGVDLMGEQQECHWQGLKHAA